MRQSPTDPAAAHSTVSSDDTPRAFLVLEHQRLNGGVKVANQWCLLLREMGVDALMSVPDGRPCDGLAAPAPTVSWDETSRLCRPFDCVIFNWSASDLEFGYALPARYMYYATQGLHVLSQCVERDAHRHLRFTAHITLTPTMRAVLRDSYGLEARLVPNFVDPAVFRPERRPPRARPRFAGMPRRGAHVLNAAAEWADCRVIDDVGERGVARALADADVFLATSLGERTPVGMAEGFPLPPLEAMACGCVVVGYAATGGLAYMEDGHNCRLIADGDAIALLAEARRFHIGWQDPDVRREVEALRSGALATAAAHSRERTADALREALAEFLTAELPAP